MREIADHFGVHYSTVSRAVRRLEAGNDQAAQLLPSREMLDCTP
jgi:transposase